MSYLEQSDNGESEVEVQAMDCEKISSSAPVQPKDMLDSIAMVNCREHAEKLKSAVASTYLDAKPSLTVSFQEHCSPSPAEQHTVHAIVEQSCPNSRSPESGKIIDASHNVSQDEDVFGDYDDSLSDALSSEDEVDDILSGDDISDADSVFSDALSELSSDDEDKFEWEPLRELTAFEKRKQRMLRKRDLPVCCCEHVRAILIGALSPSSPSWNQTSIQRHATRSSRPSLTFAQASTLSM